LLTSSFRHKRTHEQQQNGEPIIDDFNEEDLEGEDGQLIDLEHESPESDHAYLTMNIPSTIPEHYTPTSMSTGTHMNGSSMNGTHITPMLSAHHY
jgi:transcription factor STE12